MARWEPGSTDRLAQAAMELFLERGYERTTVADIAERAGLTERTFFRHFADKREVLFSGSHLLVELLQERVRSAADHLAPLDVVSESLQAAGELIQQRGDFAKQRQAVIAAHTDLRERELIKLATLGGAVADALRERGVEDPAAALVAQSGMAAFTLAFERWIAAPKGRDLPRHIRDAIADLRMAVAEG